LRLIAALAAGWGVDFKSDGKVVWVELTGSKVSTARARRRRGSA
jgi:hypothetical protein